MLYFLSLLSKKQSNEITEQSDSTHSIDLSTTTSLGILEPSIIHIHWTRQRKLTTRTLQTTTFFSFSVEFWNHVSVDLRQHNDCKKKAKRVPKGSEKPKFSAYQREQGQPPRDPSTGDASASCVDTSICSIATTSCSSTNSTANAQTLPNLQSQTRRESAHLRHCRHVANQNGNQILLK